MLLFLFVINLSANKTSFHFRVKNREAWQVGLARETGEVSHKVPTTPLLRALLLGQIYDSRI